MEFKREYCRACGAPISNTEKSDRLECEYCGSVFFYTEESEKISQIKEKASSLFQSCDFDGAKSLYQSIVMTQDDAEAYWFIALSKYGIQFVDDPKTQKKIPTCHRTLYEPILKDTDYLNALNFAPEDIREQYEIMAKNIDAIQKGILSIVESEKPYDVFICYKESDSSGKPTEESKVAKDLYYKLSMEGYSVFYAPETLKGKAAGREYEPYIYAAISTAKIMFVIAFSSEHYNAVWVKNEWSRFLFRKSQNNLLRLICCYRSLVGNIDMIPLELSRTQVIDLLDVSTNDLVSNVKTWLPKKQKTTVVHREAYSGESVAETLLQRGEIFLRDGNFSEAKKYFDKSLDENPEFCKAYWGLILAKNSCKNDEELCSLGKVISDMDEFKHALEFASGAEQDRYLQIKHKIEEKIDGTIIALNKKRNELLLKEADEARTIEANYIRARESYLKHLDELKQTEAAILSSTKKLRDEVEPQLEKIDKIKEKIKGFIEDPKFDVNSLPSDLRDSLYDGSYSKEITEALQKIRVAKDISQGDSTITKLIRKQKKILFDMEEYEKALIKAKKDYENLLYSLKSIEKEFEPAFSQVKKGDYELSSRLLSL